MNLPSLTNSQTYSVSFADFWLHLSKSSRACLHSVCTKIPQKQGLRRYLELCVRVARYGLASGDDWRIDFGRRGGSSTNHNFLIVLKVFTNSKLNGTCQDWYLKSCWCVGYLIIFALVMGIIVWTCDGILFLIMLLVLKIQNLPIGKNEHKYRHSYRKISIFGSFSFINCK